MLVAYRLFRRNDESHVEETLGYFMSTDIAEAEKEQYILMHGEHNRDTTHIEDIEIKA